MELEERFEVVRREPIEGGHSVAIKEKLIIREHGRERTVLFKRTSEAEVYALQAVAGSAAAVPELVAVGEDDRGPWIVTPFYSGGPPEAEVEIPAEVATALATVHAEHRGSACDNTLPVIDQASLPEICAAPRLAALVREGRRTLGPILDRIRSWSDHPVLSAELATQPRTLVHGDVHRNNVIIGGEGSHLVDWAATKHALPMYDLVTLGGTGHAAHDHYCATWRALTGQDPDAPAWQRGYLTAVVCVNVGYVAFAARHFGDRAAIDLVDRAAEALRHLEAITA